MAFEIGAAVLWAVGARRVISMPGDGGDDWKR